MNDEVVVEVPCATAAAAVGVVLPSSSLKGDAAAGDEMTRYASLLEGSHKAKGRPFHFFHRMNYACCIHVAPQKLSI